MNRQKAKKIGVLFVSIKQQLGVLSTQEHVDHSSPSLFLLHSFFFFIEVTTRQSVD